MRIGFLSSSTGWGGLERNALRYAQWMRERGHDVTVHCVEGSRLAMQSAGSGLATRLIRRHPRYGAFLSALALRSYLRVSQTDVLWIRDPRDLPMCSLAVRGLDCALLFHQGMQILKPKRAPWHRLRFGSVARWVAPLEQLKSQAIQQTPLTAGDISVIPLALEDRWFSDPPASDARVRWGLPEEAKVVGLFGRFDPLKGQESLLRALALLEDDAWHALIVGENTPNDPRDYRSELMRLAGELGVTHRVHWRDATDDLQSAYDACDAYAMCSASETIGMVTIEALARRIPVCGTNAGGTTELLGHGAFGRLFAPGDFKALAQALRTVDGCPVASDEHRMQFSKAEVLDKWDHVLASLRPSAL